MTNRDYFHRTFSKLQPSRDYLAEVNGMMEKRKIRLPKAAAATIIAVAMTAGTSGICYAADVGGIQRQIQIWTMGDQTDAVLKFNSEDGSYDVSYKDTDGTTSEMHGGGTVIEANGTERPVTDSEAEEHIRNMPEVITGDDGSCTLYYQGQSVDITNLFGQDGYCYLTLVNEDSGKTVYLTVGQDGSVAMSENRYAIPGIDFNIGKE